MRECLIPACTHTKLPLLGSEVVLHAESRDLAEGVVAVYARVPWTASRRQLHASLGRRQPFVAELLIDGHGVIQGRGLSWHEAGAATAFALFHAVARRAVDFVILHAAVVETSAGVVVIVAPSRLGKTTLAVRLALRGAGFLSDEAAPLRRDDGLLLPFPRAVGVRPGPLKEQLERGTSGEPIGLRVEERGGRPKLLVDLAGRVALGTGGRVRHVVFLDPGRGGEPVGEVDWVLDVDRLAAGLVEGLAAIPGVTSVAVVGGDAEPSLRVVARSDARLSLAVDRLCDEVGCHLVRMVEESNNACDWSVEPTMSEVAPPVGVLRAARHLLNGSGSRLLDAELGGSAGALVMELATALGQARFWQLRVGRLEGMCECVETLR